MSMRGLDASTIKHVIGELLPIALRNDELIAGPAKVTDAAVNKYGSERRVISRIFDTSQAAEDAP